MEEKPQAQNSIYSSWIPEGGVGEEGGIPSPPALRKNGALKALALIPSPFSLPQDWATSELGQQVLSQLMLRM